MIKILFSDVIYDIFINLIVVIIGSFLTYLIVKRKEIFLRLQSIKRFNKDIRISIAYLYRIKINNNYLLVKGNNIIQYQPVGGVYKTYESFKSLADDWDIRSDNNERFYENRDLRVIIQGKHLLAFVNWFESCKNREITAYRELNEELIQEDILNSADLFNLEIEFIKRVRKKINYSQHFGMEQLHIYDIYEINLDEISEDKIRDSIEENDYLVLVSEDEINKECFEKDGKSTKIGEHAKHILGGS